LTGLLVLGGALVVLLVTTTPWSPLAGHALRGRVAADPHADFSAAQIAREDAYHRAVRPPAYLSLAIGLAVATVLGLTPLGARLVEAVARPLGRGWVWQAVLGGLAVSLVGRLVTLPFDAWTEVVLRRYGLSVQTWPGWLADQARGLGIAAVLLSVVAIGFFGLARWLPNAWWLPAAVGGAALVLAVSFLYPVVVEPVFNKFTPLPAGELRTSLLDLARRDGLPVENVLVADASRRTTALNAYVSGFGRTRRIVVYDTLLRTSPDEVRLVVAHELGHAKRDDVLHGTAAGALAMAASACLLFLLMTWPPLLRRAGVESAGDARAVALLLFLSAALSFLGSPAQNLVSRRVEARADVHALDLTSDPQTFIASERRLALRNLADLDPNPVVYGLFATHPTPPERIAIARSWARQHG
jgi:STE24 endopeptidase